MNENGSKITWHQKISFKTALLSWVLVLVTLMIFIFSTLPPQRKILKERMNSEARDIAFSIGQETATALENNDYKLIDDYCLKQIEQNKSIVYIVFTRNDGFSLIYEKNSRRKGILRNIFVSKENSGKGLFIFSDLIRQEVFHYSYPINYSRWDKINLGLSLLTYKKNLADLYSRTVIPALISVLFGFMVAVYYARQITKPILRLDRVSQRVGKGDLNARVKIETYDELGRLSQSFNEMTESLKNSQAILEKKVEERTIELEEANSALQQDIKKREIIENELIKAKELAEQSDKLKSEFLAQISHEIRAPINIMLNHLSLLKEEIPPPHNEDTKFSLGVIHSSSRRLIRTIDLILNMSQIQTGNIECNYSNLNIETDVLREIINEFSIAASIKNLSLNFYTLCNNLTIYADSYSVIQIFTNLIDNAIKYTKKGNIDVRIYENKSENICVDVADQGIGIAEEFQKNLFRPFTQEEQGYTRKYDGNGLGLALVKKYCELNNAVISFVSKKGEGTTFTVEFLPV